MNTSQADALGTGNVTPKAWNVLTAVHVGTHSTIRDLLAELPERQVRVTDSKIRDYETPHRKRKVKLVAPEVNQLGFARGPVSAKKIIERGLDYPNLEKSPIDALVKLRKQYYDQPKRDTCIGSHDSVTSSDPVKLLTARRSKGGIMTIETYPGGDAKYDLDHRFVFEVYKDN